MLPAGTILVSLAGNEQGSVRLSLRFNREEFCDGLYLHRKTPPLTIFVGSQAAFFTAG